MNERYAFIEKQLKDYKLNKRLLDAFSKNGMPAPEATAWYVSAIDDLLNMASEEEIALLEARYFRLSPLTAWQVANQMYISRTEFYRRRNILLDWLDKRMKCPALDKECV